MSTVYVVQDQQRWDPVRKALTPKWPDLASKASEYGGVHFLLSPSAAPWNSEPILKELTDKLGGYTDEDYLLLVGNPVLIGMATAVAAHANSGYVRLLQWNGKEKRYIPVEAQVFPAERGRAAR